MFDTLNEALKLRQGYGTTYILGEVKINEDPIAKDRIKVAVPGLYDPDQGEVPWVGTLKWSPFGQGKNWGWYGSPAVGSDIAIELQEGDPNYPLYHSVQRYAPPEEFSKSGKVWGFKDPKGNVFRCDLETGDVLFTTPSGVVINIDENGKIKVVGKTEAEIEVPTLYVKADTHFTGNLTSNGVDISSTHVHGEVMSGGSNTGVPVGGSSSGGIEGGL